MAKRLVVLIGMLAILLAAVVPAFAQQQLTATGVLEKLGPAPSGEPGPRYAITDEASGTSYELFSVRTDLEPFVGQRVTIDGVPADAPPSQPGFSNLLGVTRVEPAGGSPDGGQQDRTATLSFELTVKGDPPAGTTFLGFIPAEGGISAPLTDPDGDGVFTGSVEVPKFPPGPAPSGTEPVSLPVQIAQNNGGSIQVIKDFGLVKIDGDKTFSAKVNFNKGNRGGTTTPESTAPDTTTPATGTGGSDNSGSSGNGSSGAVGSGSGGSDNGGDPVSGSSGNGGSGKAGGRSPSGPGGIKALPKTGGATLTTLGVGVLLIGSGLLIRKVLK